jgi:hypothetical protein
MRASESDHLTKVKRTEHVGKDEPTWNKHMFKVLRPYREMNHTLQSNFFEYKEIRYWREKPSFKESHVTECTHSI